MNQNIKEINKLFKEIYGEAIEDLVYGNTKKERERLKEQQDKYDRIVKSIDDELLSES